MTTLGTDRRNSGLRAGRAIKFYTILVTMWLFIARRLAPSLRSGANLTQKRGILVTCIVIYYLPSFDSFLTINLGTRVFIDLVLAVISAKVFVGASISLLFSMSRRYFSKRFLSISSAFRCLRITFSIFRVSFSVLSSINVSLWPFWVLLEISIRMSRFILDFSLYFIWAIIDLMPFL